MKQGQQYPTTLLRQRRQVNNLLKQKINSLFADAYIAKQVEQCTLPGRKIRSILFLNAAKHISSCPDLEFTRNIVFAIELSHAASVLVDDILDNDQLRHGVHATQQIWGSNKSLLFSHLLSSAALCAMSPYPALQQKLIDSYTRMCVGEMYDVFLIPGDWPFDGYDARTYQKTGAIFDFALSAAAYGSLDPANEAALGKIGRQLGKLYQLSNDFYDWQPENISKRHEQGHSWPVTFSFPLAIHLSLFGKNLIDKYLDKSSLTFSEWRDMIQIVWQPKVRARCQEILDQECRTFLEMLNANVNIPPLHRLFMQMSSLIVSDEFWYHTYEMS